MILAEGLSGANSIHDISEIGFGLLDFEAVDLGRLQWNVVDEAVPNCVVVFSDDLKTFFCANSREVMPMRIFQEGMKFK